MKEGNVQRNSNTEKKPAVKFDNQTPYQDFDELYQEAEAQKLAKERSRQKRRQIEEQL